MPLQQALLNRVCGEIQIAKALASERDKLVKFSSRIASTLGHWFRAAGAVFAIFVITRFSVSIVN